MNVTQMLEKAARNWRVLLCTFLLGAGCAYGVIRFTVDRSSAAAIAEYSAERSEITSIIKSNAGSIEIIRNILLTLKAHEQGIGVGGGR